MYEVLDDSNELALTIYTDFANNCYHFMNKSDIC